MKPYETILTETVGDHLLKVTLNRPEVHNAFDDALIASLTEAYRMASDSSEIRAILLRANGRTFSAGADLAWMRKMARYTEEDNRADARAQYRARRPARCRAWPARG